MKKALALLIALATALTLIPAMADAPVITVRGTGVVTMDADMATIVIGVRESAEDVATAQATVNTKLVDVVAKLKSMGIEDGDIQTSSIYIYPEYDYDVTPSIVAAYTAENTISVTTRDIQNVGTYIDTAFEAGANLFNDISFSAVDVSAQSDEALRLAIQHACAKAEVVAEAAGAGLGALVSISEAEYADTGDLARFAAEEAKSDGAKTEVYATKLSITATVVAQFELTPKE